MNDDMRRAIEDLRHLMTCRCDQPWADRGMHMPDCDAEYRDDLELILAAAEQDRERIDRVIGICAQVDPEKEPISAFFAATVVHALFPRKAAT